VSFCESGLILPFERHFLLQDTKNIAINVKIKYFTVKNSFFVGFGKKKFYALGEL